MDVPCCSLAPVQKCAQGSSICPNRSSINLPKLESACRSKRLCSAGAQHGEAGVLPWDRFASWIHCVCVVTFDLELGQAMEMVYPTHAELTELEKMNICYLAFPDSNSGCMGDTSYYVRMRRFTSRPLRPQHLLYNSRCMHTLKIDSNYYYGYVYFRQVKDKTLPRGYFQKSIVIVSLLPLVSLFMHVVEAIAPHFFESGEPALEAACHDIDQWPPPDPIFTQNPSNVKSGVSSTLNLPLMGAVIQCKLPGRDLSNIFGNAGNVISLMANSPQRMNASSVTVILPSVHELPMFEYVSPLVHHLQLLWELVILNEPLAVMAPTPKISSGVIHSLISLIWPLRYAVDYRPFFTIHDSEFKEYTSNGRATIPTVMLGVTNPFFSKTVQNWPHIVRLAEPSTSTSPLCNKRTQKSSDIKTLDNKMGLYTRYKPCLTKDKVFVKKVLQGVDAERPEAAQTALVRRHFLELTHSFMIPLERYLASLMPLRRFLSPLKGPPSLRNFDINEMISSLDSQGPDLTTGVRGNWMGLYRHFARTQNFAAWHARRRRDMQHMLSVAHAEVVLAADWAQLNVAQLGEAQIVDLMFMLKEKLDYMEAHSDAAPANFRLKMIGQIEAVLKLVNEDLRLVLLSNRQLALRRICSIEYVKSLVE